MYIHIYIYMYRERERDIIVTSQCIIGIYVITIN